MINLDENFFKETEDRVNKGKNWFNKVKFSDRDKYLVKIGYEKAINDVLRLLK